jgi:hypothetical protein
VAKYSTPYRAPNGGNWRSKQNNKALRTGILLY